MTAQPSGEAGEAPSSRSGRRGHGGPAPFLKWAGGKGQLLDVILPRLPAEIPGTYVEPFIGGGAVFFELARLGRIRKAKLFDRNRDLVDTYLAVRDDVEAVLMALAPHKNDEDYYYQVRAIDPATLSLPARAARTIFLNRVGYNGLYRVNSSGRFNVPFGRYRNPRILDDVGLRSASRALSCAEIAVADFEDSCATATAGDVVYLDPPYIPLSPTANFTAYAEGRFGEEEHKRLASTFAKLVDRGAYALLSNSDTELSRTLYAGFKQVSVEANRAINSKADKRGPVFELLVQGLRV